MKSGSKTKCPEPSRMMRAIGKPDASPPASPSSRNSAKFLRPELHRLLVAPGGFVVNSSDFRRRTARLGTSGVAVHCAVHAVRLARGNRQQHPSPCRAWEETGPRCCAPAAADRIPACETTTRPAKMPRACSTRKRAVAQRFGVEAATDQAVGFKPERGRREVDGILEVPALRLKVMRPQVHPFGPDDPG